MANASSRPQSPNPGITSGAKVGIAVAAGFGIVALFAMGSWLWWRRRQKRKLAKDMINFVDGDIVNLVDGGRFEKRPDKPPAPYDPYFPSSSHSTTPSPVYQHSVPASVYHPSASSSLYPHSTPSPTYPPLPTPDHHAGYYAPAAPPTREELPPSMPREPVPPPSAPATDHNAWANASRHPWSPPDYDVHSPTSYDAMQGNYNPPLSSSPGEDLKGARPVEALPAILPDPRPQPQAELPAREGHHGWGHEQELPAPSQTHLRRQGPPQGHEIDEQKFLLADVMPMKQQKARQPGAGSAG